MHAIVVTVSIAAGQAEAARKSLHEEVVPRASKAPGFVKGYWTMGADAGHGMSFIVFKTERDAQDAAKMVRSTPVPPGVTLTGVEIREVIAEG
jgi:hypothetical protein